MTIARVKSTVRGVIAAKTVPVEQLETASILRTTLQFTRDACTIWNVNQAFARESAVEVVPKDKSLLAASSNPVPSPTDAMTSTQAALTTSVEAATLISIYAGNALKTVVSENSRRSVRHNELILFFGYDFDTPVSVPGRKYFPQWGCKLILKSQWV